MGVKRGVLLCVLLLSGAILAFAAESIRVRCEVMEVSEPVTSASDRLQEIHFLLLHHAERTDRETLSRWLKANSGNEVTFVVNHKESRGVLFRLAHCFGRGLLIYEDDVKVKGKDIIEVILPVSP